MNEQLQSAVTKILERAISGIDSSVEFMQAELPDVIEQLLVWYAVKGALLSLIGFILITLSLVIVVKSFKSKPEMTDNFKPSILWVRGSYSWNRNEVVARGEACFLIGLCSLVMFIIGILMFCTNLMEPIQILVAPKIWLMEYAANMVK